MTRSTVFLVIVALMLVTLGGCSGEDQAEFIVCESTYALCTTAQCQPVAGNDDIAACDCDVETGYSAGAKPCEGQVQTAEGTQIRSRYYPIKSYAACDNDRPWAWCLDMPCLIEKSDPGKASCACKSVKDKGPYLVVTDTYSDTTCTTNLWSSATISDVTEVTDFLKTNDDLKPFEIKVLNSPD
jgi:hypothetical protein